MSVCKHTERENCNRGDVRVSCVSADSVADVELSQDSNTYAIVLHDYAPFRRDEIELRVGERVKVLSNDCRHSGGEGWWVGEEPGTGRIGVFPGAYVVLSCRTQLPFNSTGGPDISNNLCTLGSTTTSLSPDSSVSPEPNGPKKFVGSTTSSDLTSPAKTDVTNLKLDITQQQADVSQVVLRNGVKNPEHHVKVISSSEIIQQQFIGSGAFGTVYRGQWGDRTVALKVINLPSSQIDKEASHLCRLSHRNVIQFYGVCQLADLHFPALVMEFACGGPLHTVLMQHPVLTPSTLLNWAIQIATGMFYLHSEAKLVHRDLKSANILIRESVSHPYRDEDLRRCTLVITDFGMACRSSELVPHQSKLGTVAYAAPEVCRQAGFSFKSDVWSYGVVLWELLTLEVPFRTMEQPRLMYIIAMYNYTLHIPSDVPDTFSHLLRDCWSPEPDKRPSFGDIIARLQSTVCCEFLSIDAEELSHIQSGWRDSIQAHRRAEEESAAATLSSSMTRSQLAVVESELAAQMELLRHERESLDRERRQLAVRAHQIYLMEESYTRMVGTMGKQFMLLAVLAANQLKEIPCQPLPKPPPRKRPFVLSLFRRWGSTGEAQKSITTTNNTGTATKEQSKHTSGPQRSIATNTVSSRSLTRSSESLTTQGSPRLGCSRGGIPLISPPVNMKHVVHVDQDWLSGSGLNESSSITMFPTGVAEHFSDRQTDLLCASLRSTHTDQFPVLSSDCFQQNHTSPCPCSTSITPTENSSCEKRSSSVKSLVNRPAHLWDTCALLPPSDVDKRDRSLSRMLRKAAMQTTGGSAESNDVLASTSSVTVGSSNFFLTSGSTPSPKDFRSSQCVDSNMEFLWNHNAPASSCSSGPDPDGSNSTNPSPKSGRKRFISGPNLPCWDGIQMERNGSQRCRHCQMMQSDVRCGPYGHSRDDFFQLLCTMYPLANIPPSGFDAETSPCGSCVEHALWSAFQLAASFSCLANNTCIRDQNSQIANPLHHPTCFEHKRTPSDESVTNPGASYQAQQSNPCRSRFGRSKRGKTSATELKDLASTTSSQLSNMPTVDCRRRFQSADCQPSGSLGSSVCHACRRMATLPELIDECLARQAELGDPHSPFLGMLAGSGRRPTAYTNHLRRVSNNQICMNHHVCNETADHPHHSQPRLTRSPAERLLCSRSSSTATDHVWVRASFDALPGLISSKTVTDSTESKAADTGDNLEVLVSKPRLRSAEQTRARTRPTDFSSQPALTYTSYNPVAASRDAYLKATQDGYLNRTDEEVGSLDEMSDTYVAKTLRTIPSSRFNRSYCNPVFYAQTGDASGTTGSHTLSLDSIDVKEVKGRYMDRFSQLDIGCPMRLMDGDEEDTLESEHHLCVCHHYVPPRTHDEEGDGITLVPIDRWGPRFAEDDVLEDEEEETESVIITVPPVVPPRSSTRTQSTPSIPNTGSHSCATPATVERSPRRRFKRTPAMREAKRPDFFVRNNSECETKTHMQTRNE